MNMLLHGIKFSNFKIENGDTFEADAFGDKQFDAVVANPPFSAEWSAADKFNNDDRFSKAGRLAPAKTADYAFILHMIYHLNDGGTMACLHLMVYCSVVMPKVQFVVSLRIRIILMRLLTSGKHLLRYFDSDPHNRDEEMP